MAPVPGDLKKDDPPTGLRFRLRGLGGFATAVVRARPQGRVIFAVVVSGGEQNRG